MSATPEAQAFEVALPVRWSDQDLNGHVNNARVVTLLEELRIAAHLEWTGSAPEQGDPRVVRTLAVDYLHPVHHRGALEGRLWASRLGGSSFALQHLLLQDGVPVVAAQAVMVQLEPDQSRPRPLDEDQRAVLARVLRPDVTAVDEAARLATA